MKFQNTGFILFFVVLLSAFAFIFSGCSNNDDEQTPAIKVAISSFSPQQGLPGTMVTIGGTGFGTSGNEVKFNGVTAAVTTATATQLTVIVPEGATTGKITVATGGETSASSSDFVVPTPSIASFNPAMGVVGDEVTITGTNFGTVTADPTVTINGSTAQVKSVSATQITVVVPAEATTGKIKVSIKGQSATSTDNFSVPDPTITSFTPNIGAEKVVVAITGTNFSDIIDNNLVKFNGVAGTVMDASRTELFVMMPAAVTTGKITVKVGPHTATSAADLTVCDQPELFIFKFEIVSISTDNTEVSYKLTIMNAGGKPLDLTKYVLQSSVSTNADFTGSVQAAGGVILDAGGTVQSGGQTVFEWSSNTSLTGATFAEYPYLRIYCDPKTTASECNMNNNVFTTRVAK